MLTEIACQYDEATLVSFIDFSIHLDNLLRDRVYLPHADNHTTTTFRAYAVGTLHPRRKEGDTTFCATTAAVINSRLHSVPNELLAKHRESPKELTTQTLSKK